MSDTVKKYHETSTQGIYPGDILIHESPDGGKTIKSRPISKPTKKDKYVQQVKKNFEQRSQLGISKYNTTLERKDVDLLGWLNHLQEELMDATLYIERLKDETTQNS